MILNTIIAHKRKELAAEQAQVPLTQLEREVMNLPPTRDFRDAITGSDTVKLIAEVKKNHPVKVSSAKISIRSQLPKPTSKTVLLRSPC